MRVNRLRRIFAFVGSTLVAAFALTAVASADLTVNEGQQFSGNVGSFVESCPVDLEFHRHDCSGLDPSVTIAWGDGGTSAGTVTSESIRTIGGPKTCATLNPNPATCTFDVSGTYTYAQSSTFRPSPWAGSVAWSDPSGASGSFGFNATVNDLPISLANAAITRSGQEATLTATLTDQNPLAQECDYSVQIVWGDGQTTGGTVNGNPCITLARDSASRTRSRHRHRHRRGRGGVRAHIAANTTWSIGGTHTYSTEPIGQAVLTVTDRWGLQTQSVNLDAPGPPGVTTEAATSVGQTQATVNGFVDPRGAQVTDCRFDWGTDASYGHMAPCNPTTPNSPQAVSATLGGLTPDTSYHFQLVVSTTVSTVTGGDQSLTTLKPVAAGAPTVLTGLADGISASGAVLHAVVNPNGPTVADCHFEWGTTANYGSVSPCLPAPSGSADVNVTAQLMGLNAATTYHFRIVAANAGYPASQGADATFTTLSLPIEPCQATPRIGCRRPLVFAPAQLLTQATEPCVLYPCASSPQLHAGWQATLGSLSTDYCGMFQCPAPMDLVPTHGFDDNLFPLNPDWAYRVETGQPPDAFQLCRGFRGSTFGGSPVRRPPQKPFLAYSSSTPGLCTSQQVSFDWGSGPVDGFCDSGDGAFHGHINWEPATYEGTLHWFDNSSEVTDGDYSLDLHTLTGGGVTAGNNPGGNIHIEFSSDETIDHFDSSSWWQGFHRAVDSPESYRNASIWVNGHRAEVTGLVGLDTVHGAAAELHPVYAMAIQTASNGGLRDRDQWAFFARNFGDEGFCSHLDYPLPPGPLTVRIPWRVETIGSGPQARMVPATGVRVVRQDDIWSTNINGGGSVTMSVIRGEGLLLKFDLSTDPNDQPLYFGTITLNWDFAPPQNTSGTKSGPSGPPAVQGSVARAGGGDEDVEALVQRLWNRLPGRVRSTLLALLPHPRITPSRRVRLIGIPPPVSPLRQIDAFVPPRLNHTTIVRDKAQARILCAAYRFRVPGYPTLCRPLRHR